MSSNNEEIKPENAGKTWTAEEDKQLIAEFKSEMNLNEICKNHQRNIDGIAARLVRLNLIKDRKELDGYSEARKKQRANNKIIKLTAETKSVVETNTPTLTKPVKEKKKTNNQIEYIILQNNVKEIKNDIKELKDSVNKLTEMLKTVYDFKDT
jgi:hypothetical protein